MKKLSLLLVTLLIASVSFAYADDDNTGSTDDNQEETTSTDDSTMTGSGKPVPTLYQNREMNEQRKQEMEALREQKKQEIEANKEKMKENRQEFKDQKASMDKPVLTDEQKVQLKAIMDAHKTASEEIKNMVASGSLSKEDAAIKLDALRQDTFEKVKALLGNEEIAMQLLGMRKDVIEKNKELRDDNKQIRQDYKDARQNLRVKYKTQFMNALGNRLDNMDQAKLQLVLTRIDDAIAKTEANTALSQTNKDKLLAQLDALKEIINEKLSSMDPNSNIDINSLLQ